MAVYTPVWTTTLPDEPADRFSTPSAVPSSLTTTSSKPSCRDSRPRARPARRRAGHGEDAHCPVVATALDLSFNRVQFTPDLLPSDITGSNVFDEATGEFEFQPGPVFANVVLADEINRAPPKTQAALLEAMGEKQVTVDGVTHDLPSRSLSSPRRTPSNRRGRSACPRRSGIASSSRPRSGIPTSAANANSSTGGPTGPHRHRASPRHRRRAAAGAPRTVESVTVDGTLRDYVVELGRATREDDRVDVGVSPRGIQRLFEATRAAAVLDGRDYAVPDDVKAVVEEAFAHRLVLTADAGVRGVDPATVVDDVLDRVEVPAVSP